MKAGCLPLFLQRFIGSVGLKQFQAIWHLAGLSLGFQAATLDEELAAVQKTKKQRSGPYTAVQRHHVYKPKIIFVIKIKNRPCYPKASIKAHSFCFEINK